MNSSHLLKVSRLEGLTDGIFAIAMTILVLDLKLPGSATFLTSAIYIRLAVYVGSFIILGTLWVAMNFQLGLIERLNRPYLWTNILYLMVICVVPFSASLVAAFPNHPGSISFFAVNLLFASSGQLLTFVTAHHYKLNKSSYSEGIKRAIINRIYVAPIFYISALLVAHWNTSIAFLLLVAPPTIYLIPGKIDTFDK